MPTIIHLTLFTQHEGVGYDNIPFIQYTACNHKSHNLLITQSMHRYHNRYLSRNARSNTNKNNEQLPHASTWSSAISYAHNTFTLILLFNVIKAGGNTNIKIDRLHWKHTHIFNSGYFMFVEMAN